VNTSSPSFLQRTWNYDPQGDSSNDRIGKILARGVDLSATLRAEAGHSATKAREMELSEKAHQHDAPAMIMGATSSSVGSSADKRGMVWVDSKGEVLGPVTTETFKPPEKPASSLDMCNEKQLAVASMTPLERSMHMWRKVRALRGMDTP